MKLLVKVVLVFLALVYASPLLSREATDIAANQNALKRVLIVSKVSDPDVIPLAIDCANWY